jgi:hypothetical protein
VSPATSAGARKFPVGPSRDASISADAEPVGANVRTDFPLATITRFAAFASRAASALPSFRLAETVSVGTSFFASRNLDARVQLVQPLRW